MVHDVADDCGGNSYVEAASSFEEEKTYRGARRLRSDLVDSKPAPLKPEGCNTPANQAQWLKPESFDGIYGTAEAVPSLRNGEPGNDGAPAVIAG
jgi:hypothetical protein